MALGLATAPILYAAEEFPVRAYARCAVLRGSLLNRARRRSLSV